MAIADKLLIDFEKGPDTGDTTTDSISPILDGEDATQAVFQRPSESLRGRTETLRDAVEALNYLSSSDRAFFIAGGGKIVWAGLATGSFTIDADLVLRPFMAPPSTVPAELDIGGVKLTARTADFNGVHPLRAYGRLGEVIPGANKYSFEVIVSAGATKKLERYGDSRHWKLTVAPTDTINTVYAFLATDATANADILELRNRYALALTTGTPNNAMPAFAKTYWTKALDAEVHRITPAGLATFFGTAANLMTQEGDVLCIRYDALVMASGGGRRQSLNQAPENSSDVANNLFLLRNHPEWLAYALPVATVYGGNLVLANGATYLQAAPGEALARAGSLTSYAGASIGIGGGATGDTVRAALAGQGGAGLKDGVLVLYRDGAAPVTLDYDALTALVNHGDANAYHTHTSILQRWKPAANTAIGTAFATVKTFTFATSQANQVIEVDLNMLIQLTADSMVQWQLILDGNTGAPVYTGNTGTAVSASTDPDNPDVPVNDTPWVTIPAAATNHTIAIQIATPGGASTLKTTSKFTLC